MRNVTRRRLTVHRCRCERKEVRATARPVPSPRSIRPATPVYSRGGACLRPVGLPPPCGLASALWACPRPVGLPPPCGGAGQPLMKRFRSPLWGLPPPRGHFPFHDDAHGVFMTLPCHTISRY